MFMAFDWTKYANMFGNRSQASGGDPVTSAGQGAAQGALGGAALGPWGAVAGGVLGAAGSAINASDEAANKQVDDQDKENELKLLYQKFLQGSRVTEEDRARSGMNMFLDIGNQARKEYRGQARNSALRAVGVV
jgi:hypothetical protein